MIPKGGDGTFSHLSLVKANIFPIKTFDLRMRVSYKEIYIYIYSISYGLKIYKINKIKDLSIKIGKETYFEKYICLFF